MGSDWADGEALPALLHAATHGGWERDEFVEGVRRESDEQHAPRRW